MKPHLEKIKELVDTIGRITDLVQSKKSKDEINAQEIQSLSLPGTFLVALFGD